ncbi:MAG: PIN domain-containing protein [Chloroflexi bacterium]|nr:PIN domain-containing protein [Chloroflexota bacterium]
MSRRFVLDTNVISDVIKNFEPVVDRLKASFRDGDTLILVPPVDFEIRRGLSYVGAHRQILIYDERLKTELVWEALTDDDWIAASALWVENRRLGKTSSDLDLLIAAQTRRLDASLITSDNDFESLPVTRVNWRLA